LAFDRTRYSRRLHFGEPVRRAGAGGSVTHAYFEPGALFAYVVWEAGAYGTKRWELLVCRAGRLGETLQAVDGIEPGAVVLLHARTAHYVRRALAVMDQVKAMGTDFEDVSEGYWRRVHAAFASRTEPPPFGPLRAANACLRKAVKR
jgi:hypothetical protein